jgi:hypothetical protein
VTPGEGCDRGAGDRDPADLDPADEPGPADHLTPGRAADRAPDRPDGWDDGWDDDWGDDWGHHGGAGGAGAAGGAGEGWGHQRGPGLDDPRVAAGVEHLQRAAREVIAASRALLDAAEDLVEQPEGISRLAGVVADLGDLAGRTMRAATGAPGPSRRRADGSGAGGPDDDPPVQRIPVS